MKAKKQTIGVITQIDVIKNSAGKMNRSMEIVRQGCGVQKNKKAYNRKNKHKDNSDYDRGFNVI